MTDPTPELRAAVRLNLTPGVGPRTAEVLCGTFGSPAAVFAASDGELRRVRGIGGKVIGALRRTSERAAEEELRKAADAGVDRPAPGRPRLSAAAGGDPHRPPRAVCERFPDPSRRLRRRDGRLAPLFDLRDPHRRRPGPQLGAGRTDGGQRDGAGDRRRRPPRRPGGRRPHAGRHRDRHEHRLPAPAPRPRGRDRRKRGDRHGVPHGSGSHPRPVPAAEPGDRGAVAGHDPGRSRPQKRGPAHRSGTPWSRTATCSPSPAGSTTAATVAWTPSATVPC